MLSNNEVSDHLYLLSNTAWIKKHQTSSWINFLLIEEQFPQSLCSVLHNPRASSDLISFWLCNPDHASHVVSQPPCLQNVDNVYFSGLCASDKVTAPQYWYFYLDESLQTTRTSTLWIFFINIKLKFRQRYVFLLLLRSPFYFVKIEAVFHFSISILCKWRPSVNGGKFHIGTPFFLSS